MNCPVPVTAGSPLRGRCHLCLGIFKKGWEQLGPGDGWRLVRVHERRHRRTDAREDKRGSCNKKCDERDTLGETRQRCKQQGANSSMVTPASLEGRWGKD